MAFDERVGRGGSNTPLNAATVQPAQSWIRYARPCTLPVSVMLPVQGGPGFQSHPTDFGRWRSKNSIIEALGGA